MLCDIIIIHSEGGSDINIHQKVVQCALALVPTITACALHDKRTRALYKLYNLSRCGQNVAPMGPLPLVRDQDPPGVGKLVCGSCHAAPRAPTLGE
jgi:hypothetical protein